MRNTLSQLAGAVYLEFSSQGCAHGSSGHGLLLPFALVLMQGKLF